MTDRPALSDVWAGPVNLPPLDLSGGLRAAQALWRSDLSDELYGPLPPPPTGMSVARQPLPRDNAERLVITVEARGTQFEVDAALWLPEGAGPNTPVICGLDFAGPIGVLTSEAFPVDPAARVFTRPELGASEGRLHDVLRGTARHRWPVDLLTAEGYAVLISCYGSWVPDDPLLWVAHGVQPVLGDPEAGAISLWAWSLCRLVDAARRVGLDGPAVVAGHSRLGKAALWATAHDARIKAVFANQSGAAGAALSCHPIGESLAQLAKQFPHWLRPDPVLSPDERRTDQHHLLAACAPACVHIGSAEQDIWADPLGSHEALRLASRAWGVDGVWPSAETIWSGGAQPAGVLGHHIRPGGHDLLPYDWRRFLNTLRHLLATIESN